MFRFRCLPMAIPSFATAHPRPIFDFILGLLLRINPKKTWATSVYTFSCISWTDTSPKQESVKLNLARPG